MVRLFDVFKPLLPNASLFNDDLHANQEGHGIITNAVRAKLAP